MKHVKIFENFRNTKFGEELIKSFDTWTQPEEPFKRKLTSDENELMLRHFQNHSWSSYIDAKGRIILGGGEEEGGRFYITENDLKKLQQ